MSHYPHARRQEKADQVSGHVVSDPYRWLEDADSPETASWLNAQERLFSAYAARLPGRRPLRDRIQELQVGGNVTAPTWRGERQFFLRSSAQRDHPVLYTSGPHDLPEIARILIDPAAIDPSGRTILNSWRPDGLGRLLAYQLSTGGTEQSALRVMEVATGSDIDGPIGRCRFSPVAWLSGEDAFYYISAAHPADQECGQCVYLHRVGSRSHDDVLIAAGGGDGIGFGVSVSQDGRWLLISATQGSRAANDLWIADLQASDPTAPDLYPVQEGTGARTMGRVGPDGFLYLLTDANAPRQRLVVTTPADPAPATWRELIPENQDVVLKDIAVLTDDSFRRPLLLAAWVRNAISELTLHDLHSGERVGSVRLPGRGSIGPLSVRPEGGPHVWFTYTDYITPTSVFRFDGRLRRTETWAGPVSDSPMRPEVRQEQISYVSRDGTPVQMMVISAPGTGPKPLLLTGYGGFGVSLVPRYSPAMLAWAEAGGAYAIAALRGGGEAGAEWHRSGTLDQKQKVFDDFIAAAETLISQGWTSAGQLGIWGESNGGLTVGAALTQRPELFAAAACAKPLLDMARYELFGLGARWRGEYGTAADPRQLSWLLSYSPYHHVTAGVSYPAVLFTVSGNDSRVDPFHACKMCASLQYASNGGPVLLRHETGTGHGATALSAYIELIADTLAFLAHHVGLHPADWDKP